MSTTTPVQTDALVPLDLETGAGFDAIVEATAHARVVFLGEGTHGDGASFAAKAAIARHLHEVGGFDVLAWEAGSYDCWRMNRAFSQGVEPIQALASGVHGIWVTEETRPLAEYISASWRTGRPFRQMGFDTQFSSVTSVDTVADDVAGWLASAHVSATPDEIHAITQLARFSLPFLEQLDAEEHLQARGRVERLLEEARRRAPDAFVVRVLDDVLRNDDVQPPLNAWVRERKASVPDGSSFADWCSETDPIYQRHFGIRDTAMANNLLQDMDRHPELRFVAWLANGHALRNVATLGDDDPRFVQLTTMGGLVHQALGDEAYVIAATSYSGAMHDGSSKPPEPMPAAVPGSLEAVLHDVAPPAAFLDLRRLPADSHWRRRCVWRAWGPEQLPTPLPDVVDAILYLDEQQPAHAAPRS